MFHKQIINVICLYIRKNVMVDNTNSQTEENNRNPEESSFKAKVGDYWAKFKVFAATRKSRLLQLILIPLALPLILFISVPLDIYAHNQAEFVFSFSDAVGGLIMLFVLLALVMATVLFVLPQKAYKIVLYVFIAIEFLFFFQGTYLNSFLFSLTGDDGNWSAFGWTDAKTIIFVILDFLVWAGVIAGIVVLSLRPDKKGYIRLVSLVMVVIVIATQVMNFIVLPISYNTVFDSYSSREEKNGKFHSLTTSNLTTVSEENNVFYFIIDRFDELFAEKAYDVDDEVFDGLTGFTWFKDNVALYGHTFPSVSYLMSNVRHNSDELREKNLDSVYKNNTPLTELYKNGYEINLFTEPYYAYNYNGNSFPDNPADPDYYKVSNFSAGTYKAERKIELSCNLTCRALYRCLPSLLKPIVKDIGLNAKSSNGCVDFYGDDGSPFYDSANKNVIRKVKNADFDVNGKKRFSMVHIVGCHSLNEHSTKKQVTRIVKESFKVVYEYIDNLKEKGLYDNATIIITGDHGDGKPNYLGTLTRPLRTALFVKPANSDSSPLKTSLAQVSHEDLWPTIMKSEGVDSGYAQQKGVFDYAENETRTRRHVHQTWESSSLDEYYYEITGPSTDIDNWKITETKHFDRHLMD